MDNLIESIDRVKRQLAVGYQEGVHYFDIIKDKSLIKFHQYYQEASSTNHELIIDDFKNLRVNFVTVSLTLTTLAFLVLLNRVLFTGSAPTKSKTKTKKKRISKAQKANKQIQAILDDVETNYIPDIDDYIVNYQTLKNDDVIYKYKYFEEMLLKELMKLDGIDVTGNEILRENRRKVIKFIQDHQKRLDKFKKEVNF